MRKITFVVLLSLLAGCGAQQHRASGIEAQTLLILRSEQLVGTTISVEPVFQKLVAKDDLTPYRVGILGAANKEEEDLETITVKVTPGLRRVTVRRADAVLLDKELYFAEGQTRELKVK